MIAMLRRRLMGGGVKRCNVTIKGNTSFYNGNTTYYPYVEIDGVKYYSDSQVQLKSGTKIYIWWFVAISAWSSAGRNAIVENGVVLQSGSGSGLYEYTVKSDCSLSCSVDSSDNSLWGYACWTIQA